MGSTFPPRMMENLDGAVDRPRETRQDENLTPSPTPGLGCHVIKRRSSVFDMFPRCCQQFVRSGYAGGEVGKIWFCLGPRQAGCSCLQANCKRCREGKDISACWRIGRGR